MGIFAFTGILTVVGAVLHLWRDKQPRTRARVYEILLLYVLAIAIGVTGVIAFSGHAFRADEIAKQIGFPPGNPFQFEVAIADLTVGVLGILCIWFRGSFWLATVVATSVWLLGDAVGHVHELVSNHNHHPGNSGPALWADIAIPVVAIVLYVLYRRARAAEDRAVAAEPRRAMAARRCGSAGAGLAHSRSRGSAARPLGGIETTPVDQFAVTASVRRSERTWETPSSRMLTP